MTRATELDHSSSVIASAPSHVITDDELESQIQHLLQKNFTTKDPLTLSNAACKEYLQNAFDSKDVITTRAKRIDEGTTKGFPDLQIRLSSLLTTIPSQEKASKTSQVAFLTKLHMVVRELQQKFNHSTRFSGLSTFSIFMDKV